MGGSMEDEPGSDMGMMFSRVDLICFRMGPLIYGKKGRISWRICTFDECFLLLLGQWNLIFPKRECHYRPFSSVLNTNGGYIK